MNVKKIIKLAILILIPVLATFFIGWYGYDFFAGKTQIKIDYYEDVQSDTKSQLEAFMKYNEYKYEKTPFYTKDVLGQNDEVLLKMEIYRAVYEFEEEIKARYIFVLYDVNGDKILKELTGDDSKYYNKAGLSIKCVPLGEDFDESDSVQPFTLSTTAARTIDGVFGIVDYVASEVSGKDASKIDPYTASTYTGAIYARWNIETNFDEDFEDLFKIQLVASATNKEDSSDDAKAEKVLFEEKTTLDADENVTEDEIKIELNSKNWNIDQMEKGYNNDEVKAGYFGWVLGHYLWWICLIALVVTFGLTYTFVAVWEYDDSTVNSKKRK